jgi:uncharacterized Zn finger protein
MTKTKPECPQCQSRAFTKLLGGGSFPKYRYKCTNPTTECDVVWQQKPEYMIEPGETVKKIISKHTRTTSSQTCKNCGQPKKNHTCTMKTNTTKFDVSAYHPPSTALANLSIGAPIPIPFSNQGQDFDLLMPSLLPQPESLLNLPPKF